ncbi:hypothetical protein [Aliarcobacter cryaerophilus]|uniref:hypothetical protein n=1 Tax=Aliarcobacter cryaerophilus TaxID=28198 RepID=UPI001D192FD8|nr:hypothetical protein [Aliarcobacter cryaerophilus]
MTNSKFIEICKEYAEANGFILHPKNISGVEYFYKSFKEFCINYLLNENEEDSVFKWMYHNSQNPNFMSEDFSIKVIGHDPVDSSKIVVGGKLRDEIHPIVEIRRGNEKNIINDIISQIKQLLKHDPSVKEGGNYIEFKNWKGEIVYFIEWRFDANYKQENIVKKVCTELGITQKELAEIMKINDVTVRNWSSKGQIPDSSIAFMELILENQKIIKENQEMKQALSILKKYS